jgi:putative membrane-bound dehydrogenase-like protein
MPHVKTRHVLATFIAVTMVAVGCASLGLLKPPQQTASGTGLTITQDDRTGTISVFRAGNPKPILTQNARADTRPYLHPIAAPDGRGVLTEYSPAHHKHQTGLYWGFTRVNGRDYFHNPQGDYWRRVSATVTQGDRKAGREGGAPGARLLRAGVQDVGWQTVYDLLDEAGNTILTETQRWSMRERNGAFVLDLEWRGDARTDLTVGKYDYGGLFLRMPWREGIAGEVVNAARQRNERAEGQRAMWIDVGMQVEGRPDLAHIAIFDHPANTGYPQAWRVDGQLGVGSARSREAAWTIGKGRSEVVRHQFLIYTGTLNDVEMTNAWSEFSGNNSTSALWSIAQREGRAAKFLTAEEAVGQMTLKDGYTVNAWAAEPMVVQPMAFCWDDRGRLWVAENLDYESRDEGFSNAGNSRILILDDTDHDGVADSRKVFMEGIVFPSAIAIGFDGVYIGAPPNLLFVPDRNGDDKADVADIEVRLTGWGISDRHEVLNSLHWGPDGWLYGLQGYATSSKVRKPSGKGRLYRHNEPFPEDILKGDGVEINGGVWRYHPTKDLFEVVAHGFSNPWGIDYDAKGQLLISACVIPHLFHVVPGGIYHRQGGQHFNPYVYSDIQTIADHRHRSAHGGARVYQSDAFPQSQRGRIFMANIHEHAVLSDVLEPKGSGFTARHGDDFLLANNAQWLGFSMEIGPEGALYVLDWHDSDICGMDVLHQQTGRIFRIMPKQSLAEPFEGRYADLSRMTDAQLVGLQTSRSDWHARRARVILQNRAAKRTLRTGTHEQLRGLFRSDASPDVRLRAMWALHVTGGWTPDALVQVLGDADEYIRAWAVQLLCEDRSPSAIAIETFTRLAREDRSPVVRLYLTSALQRMPHSARWTIADQLMTHGEDAGDQNLPKMLWLAVEPLVKENPAFALERAGGSRLPVIARFIARRAVDAGALEPLVDAIGKTPKTQTSLLEGLRDGLEGRVDLAAPPGWAPVLARLKRSDARVAQLAEDVTQQFGDTETAGRNLAIVGSSAAPIEQRRRALQTLTAQRRPQLVTKLPSALDEERLRVDAIRAVAAFDDEALGRLLIERYQSFSSVEKAEALQTLSSRRRYGRMLTEAVAKSVVPRRDVPAYVARQLRRVVGAGFTDIWGPVETLANEEQAHLRYRALLTDRAIGRANVSNGHEVYLRTCGACHKLYGEGGTVGPDLTGSNRANLDYLLFNVLNPNADVQDAYRMVMVTTRDGRTLAGNVVAETDRQITLRTVGQDSVIVNKPDIQSRETTSVSMMPPGLFDPLGDREVIDLVAYLRTAGPVK